MYVATMRWKCIIVLASLLSRAQLELTPDPKDFTLDAEKVLKLLPDLEIRDAETFPIDWVKCSQEKQIIVKTTIPVAFDYATRMEKHFTLDNPYIQAW